MPLPISLPRTDAQLAAGILAHPLMLILGDASVEALASIADRNSPAASLPERRLLRGAIDLINAAEIALGRRAA